MWYKSTILIFLTAYFIWSKTTDRILLKVDNHIVLESEFNQLLDQYEQSDNFFSDKPLTIQQKKAIILNQIIQKKVMLAIAEQDSTIEISFPKVEDILNNQLQRMSQGAGVEQLKKYFQQQGLNFDEHKTTLRNSIREELKIQQLQQKNASLFNQNLSAKKVREFYFKHRNRLPVLKNNIKLAHIETAVLPHPKTILKAYNLTDSLIQLLNNGANFEELAEEFSDDPTGENGGDIGYIKAGNLDPAFERAAYSQKIFTHSSKPVKTKYGFHIVYTTDRRNNEVRTSHILITTPLNLEDTNRTIQFLNTIKRDILNQKISFVEAAKKYSEDENTKINGGNLGWFTKDVLEEIYDESIDKLTTDKISAPLWIDQKLHLFKVLAKAKTRKLSLTDDWEQISNLAKNNQIQQKLNKLVDQWKKEVLIVNYSNIDINNLLSTY